MAELDFGSHTARAAKYIRARREDLGLSSTSGSRSYHLLRRLLNGQGTIQARLIPAYEEELRWERGSLRRLAAGKSPTELPDPDLHVTTLPGGWDTITVPTELVHEVRAFIVARWGAPEVSPRDTSTAPNPR